MSLRLAFLFLCLFMILMMSRRMGSAQPGNPRGGRDPDHPVPISGVEILIGLGSLLGIKKIHDSRKKR